MKFNAMQTVTGMKASKGDYEGVAFDSTKVYILTDMDESKGNAKGFASVEYPFGKSEMYEGFKHLTFPFKAECECEFVTNGKVQKMVIHAMKPVASAKV